MNTENIEKAAQTAELLLSDIRAAHAGVCVDKPTVSQLLLHELLLSLIGQACELQEKLESIAYAVKEGK